MTIDIEDPNSSRDVYILPTVQNINGHRIWRVALPKNETFFITRLNGQWRTIGKLIISYDLLNEIGIKLQLLAILNSLNLKYTEG